MAFGAVTWGYAAPEALLARRPARVFDAPAEILGLLDGAGSLRGSRRTASKAGEGK